MIVTDTSVQEFGRPFWGTYFEGGSGDRVRHKVRDFEPHSPKDLPASWAVSFYDMITEGRSFIISRWTGSRVWLMDLSLTPHFPETNTNTSNTKVAQTRIVTHTITTHRNLELLATYANQRPFKPPQTQRPTFTCGPQIHTYPLLHMHAGSQSPPPTLPTGNTYVSKHSPYTPPLFSQMHGDDRKTNPTADSRFHLLGLGWLAVGWGQACWRPKFRKWRHTDNKSSQQDSTRVLKMIYLDTQRFHFSGLLGNEVRSGEQ